MKLIFEFTPNNCIDKYIEKANNPQKSLSKIYHFNFDLFDLEKYITLVNLFILRKQCFFKILNDFKMFFFFISILY